MPRTGRFRSPRHRERYLAAYDETLSQWPVAVGTTTVGTRLGPTHVIEAGAPDAPPLVLLHGMAVSATSWDANIAPLARRFRTIAPDTVGDVGRSTVERQPKNPKDLADWLCDVLDALGVGRAHVMGLSYGGMLALDFAHRHPDRVDRLVACSPGGILPLRKLWLARTFSLLFWPSRGRFERYFRSFMPGWRLPNPCFEQYWAGVWSWRRARMPLWVLTDSQLATIAAPTLLALGAAEQIYDPTQAADRARRLIPDLRAEIFAGVGHAPPFECAEAFNDTVAAFLESD